MRPGERGGGATSVRVLALRLAALRLRLLWSLLGDLRGLAGGLEQRARSLARPPRVRPLHRGGGLDLSHGPSRVGRRPVGTAPVPGRFGERVRGWRRRADAYRKLRVLTCSPGYPLRRLRTLRRGDKRRRRRSGEEHRPPVHGLASRGIQRRWSDRGSLRGRLAVGGHGLPVRLSRDVDSAGGGDPRSGADRLPTMRGVVGERRGDRAFPALPERPPSSRRRDRDSRVALGGGDGALVRYLPATVARAPRARGSLRRSRLPRRDGRGTTGRSEERRVGK